MKNRQELAKLFREKGYAIGAEIGVFSGHYSEILCREIPDLFLYCIDPYMVYDGYRDHKFEKSMKDALINAVRSLQGYDVTFLFETSENAVNRFNDGMLDFVFIDGNHEYKYVKEDIELWTPKVKKGGMVAGHDYYVTKAGNVGVIQAVDEYVKENGYELHVTEWDYENPIEDDRQPTWYFNK